MNAARYSNFSDSNDDLAPVIDRYNISLSLVGLMPYILHMLRQIRFFSDVYMEMRYITHRQTARYKLSLASIQAYMPQNLPRSVHSFYGTKKAMLGSQISVVQRVYRLLFGEPDMSLQVISARNISPSIFSCPKLRLRFNLSFSTPKCRAPKCRGTVISPRYER